MTNLTGKVDAIMMTESAYYAYIYRDTGNGTYAPEQVEITPERYYQLLRENPARYTEPAYVAFEVDMQETIAGSDYMEWADEAHQEWLAQLEEDDANRAMTGDW